MARLRADVVCRCQRKHLSIPESGMIAGVIIGIADQDVENNAGKKLSECLRGFFEFGPD